MNCPKCSAGSMTHMTADDGVTALLRCIACRGVWIDAAGLDGLTEPWPQLRDDTGHDQARANDRRTGRCPLGHGVLTRARIQGTPSFFLERCATCGGMFFDAGEWSAVSRSWLAAHLADAWRGPASGGDDAPSLSQVQRLRELFGDEGLARLEAVGAMLEAHPAAGQAIAYLMARVRRQPPPITRGPPVPEPPPTAQRKRRHMGRVDDANPEGTEPPARRARGRRQD